MDAVSNVPSIGIVASLLIYLVQEYTLPSSPVVKQDSNKFQLKEASFQRGTVIILQILLVYKT